MVQRRWLPKALFVTKLSPETTEAQLCSYLTARDAAPLACKRIKTRYNTYASFYVAVSNVCYELLQDPALWPNECLFKPFRGVLRESMLHLSELSSPA